MCFDFYFCIGFMHVSKVKNRNNCISGTPLWMNEGKKTKNLEWLYICSLCIIWHFSFFFMPFFYFLLIVGHVHMQKNKNYRPEWAWCLGSHTLGRIEVIIQVVNTLSFLCDLLILTHNTKRSTRCIMS